MQKILLTTLLVSFLSCTSSLEHTSEQCSPQFVYHEANKNYISVEQSVCRCRKYKFSKESVGQVGNVYRKPFEYCSLMVGFPEKQYPVTAQFWEEVRQEINKPKKK